MVFPRSPAYFSKNTHDVIFFAFPNSIVPCREGSNCYRVEGRILKEIPISEWQNVRPFWALFTRHSYPGYVSPQAKSLPCSASGGGGRATLGRKRRREENGSSGRFGGGGDSSSSGGDRGTVAAAEVIDVDDDDSDTGDADTPPGGGGGSGARDGAGDRPNGSGSWNSSSSASNGCAESPPPDLVELAAGTPAQESTARGARGGANSAAASSRQENEEMDIECDLRDDDLAVLGQIASKANGSMLDPGASSGSSGKASGDSHSPAGRNAGNGSVSSNLASGTTPSPRRRQPRVHENVRRENRSSHEDLTADKGDDDFRRIVRDDDYDDDDNDVQMVTSNQDCDRRGDGGGGSLAVSSSSSSLPPSSCSKTAATPAESGVSTGWISRRRPPDSSPARRDSSERDDGRSCLVSSVYLDSSPREPRNTPPPRLCEREVHDIDDDASSSDPSPPSPVTLKGKLHPSGVAKPFIGPARPPEPKTKPLPPRPQPPPIIHQFSDDSSWLKPISRPTSNSHAENRNKLGRRLGGRSSTAGAAGAAASRMSGKGGSGSGSGGAKNLDGQRTITSSWEAMGSSSSKKASASSARGGGGGGASSSSNRSSKQEDEEWTPRGNGAAAAGAGGGDGSSSGGGGQRELRSREKKVTEDLTGVDEMWQGIDDWKAYGGAGADERWLSDFASTSTSRSSRSMPNDATLTTIRGINLQQDHFDRIVDSDGWLTSQVGVACARTTAAFLCA